MNRTKICAPVSRASYARTFACRPPDRIGASVATDSVCWLTASPANKPRSRIAVLDHPIPARRNVPTPAWPSNVPVYPATDWPTINAPVSVRNVRNVEILSVSYSQARHVRAIWFWPTWHENQVVITRYINSMSRPLRKIVSWKFPKFAHSSKSNSKCTKTYWSSLTFKFNSVNWLSLSAHFSVKLICGCGSWDSCPADGVVEGVTST